MNSMVIPLDQVKIASPCSAEWSKMEGDEKIRFCSECKKNVYNLSSMNRSEAEEFLHELEGVSCVRLFRRGDGTVITDDCPVGVRETRKAIYWMIGKLAAAIHLALIAIGGIEALNNKPDALAALGKIEPFATVIKWFSPSPPPSAPSRCVMGKIKG